MVTEDYVSFEVAKLLKEKGFDENCSRSYVKDKLAYSQGRNNSYYTIMYETYRPISAPTLQMAMKWLREVHNIQIELMIAHAMKKRWSYGINKDFNPCTQKIEVFCSYEEACEAAIKYCLENLI